MASGQRASQETEIFLGGIEMTMIDKWMKRRPLAMATGCMILAVPAFALAADLGQR